jgi:hypothetical protein
MVNGVPTRVVGAPESLDMVTPMSEINNQRLPPRNREPLMQPQFDIEATPTSTRPQSWGSRNVEVEDELRELRDEVHPSPSDNPRDRGSREVTSALQPPAAQMTPGMTTRAQAEWLRQQSQRAALLNSDCECAEVG